MSVFLNATSTKHLLHPFTRTRILPWKSISMISLSKILSLLQEFQLRLMKLPNLENGSLRQWRQGVGNHVLTGGTATKIWTSEKKNWLRKGKHSHDCFEMSHDQTHSNMTRVLRWWPDPVYLHPTSTVTLFTCQKNSWQQCSHLKKMEKSHGKTFVVWGSGIPPRQSGRWCPAPPISISVQRQSCDVRRVLCVPRAPWSAQRCSLGERRPWGWQ